MENEKYDTQSLLQMFRLKWTLVENNNLPTYTYCGSEFFSCEKTQNLIPINLSFHFYSLGQLVWLG